MADLRLSGMGGIPFGNTAARPANPVIGTVYYNGQLEIIEIYNGTSWVANSAPPAVPSIVSITDVGTGLAYATGGTFTIVVAPGSGGSTPLQYNAVTSVGGFSASSNSTTLSLTGLTPNTSFVVSANAQNNFGTTVNSSPFSSTLATTVPQAPTIGTATASGNSNEVTVTWTLGNTGGKNLSAITITPYLNGTTAETARTAATTSSTSYTFTDGQLTAAAAYTFKVKATNANGVSVESAATNSATMPSFFNIDYLVVAGGGGGGYEDAGGGGAGGLRSTVTATGGGGSLESALLSALSTNYTVTVGAGGAAGIFNTVAAGQGSDSVFRTITSLGGGRAGSETAVTSGLNGATGGSGGGGGGQNSGTPGTGGSGTANQGYGGGTGFIRTSGNEGGGGGGGAGAAGSNAITSRGGNGGNGVAVSITGSSVTYAGGGGGGQQGTTPGTGGTGGGGTGGSNTDNDGTAGTVNTGGGGGGGGGNAATNGSPGGSGIVILRYPDTRTITIGAGLTGTTSSASGGYKRTTLTAGTGNVSFA